MLFNFLTLRSLKDEEQNGETITQNDLVMKHYESLPYPGLSDIEISKEEQFYQMDGINSTTFQYFPGIALENTNHYIHQGGETFGQVSYNTLCLISRTRR